MAHTEGVELIPEFLKGPNNKKNKSTIRVLLCEKLWGQVLQCASFPLFALSQQPLSIRLYNVKRQV